MPKLNPRLELVRNFLIYQLEDENYTSEDIARILCISKGTVYNVINERKKANVKVR